MQPRVAVLSLSVSTVLTHCDVLLFQYWTENTSKPFERFNKYTDPSADPFKGSVRVRLRVMVGHQESRVHSKAQRAVSRTIHTVVGPNRLALTLSRSGCGQGQGS